MNKERFKSILLGFLIILNFVLGSRILIEKKLWPTGYNFFSNIGNLRISKLYENIVSYFTDGNQYEIQVLNPEKILLNTGDQTTRISLSPNDNSFEEIMSETNEILKTAFSMPSEMFTEIDKEDLYSALSVESVYLSYARKYSINLFEEFLGADTDGQTKLSENEFADIVISYSANGSKCNVYMADFDTDNYYGIGINYNSDKLRDLCDESVKKNGSEGENVINYSFDLKFDQPFGSQKTTLNPLIQVYSTTSEMPVIKAVNPIMKDEENVNETIIDNILNIFNINASTMRRYAEAGGTLVFVENNATLKIDKNGYLEYTAMDDGMELSNASGSEYSDIINLNSITSKINKALGNNEAMCLTQSDDKTIINYDYMVTGTRVVINTDNISSGVSAKVENGHLLSYKQLMRHYSIKSETLSPSEFFEALDNAIARYSEFMNEININKMFIGYNDNGIVGDKYANWIVEVDNVIVGE